MAIFPRMPAERWQVYTQPGYEPEDHDPVSPSTDVAAPEAGFEPNGPWEPFARGDTWVAWRRPLVRELASRRWEEEWLYEDKEPLHVRTENVLRKTGLVSIGDVLGKTEGELLRLGVGRGSLLDLKRFLGQRGMALRGTPSST